MTSNRGNDRKGLGRFEEKLLGELKSVVAHRKAELGALRPARTPLWRRPRVVSVASAGALAVGAVVGLPLLGGESTTPPASAAFELTTNDDGTVTVTIFEFDDADELEAQLEEHGVPADVSYTPADKRCQPDRYDPAPTQHQVDVDYGPPRAGVRLDDVNRFKLSFTLRPADFQTDETLVVVNDVWAGETVDPETGTVDLRIQDANVETAIGPVEPCVLEDDVTNPIRPWTHDGAVWYEFRMPAEDRG
jgi:hypothetical protein